MTNKTNYDILEPANSVLTVAPSKEETEMLGATNKITALYCRLSQEDERTGESLSIENQRMMLESYAHQNHFTNLTCFVDDGYSGVNFDRPGFQKMLEAIEADQVSTVIVKDLSRFSRNTAMSGMLINFTFAEHGVRFIAINDNYDTIDPNSVNNDFAGIKSWFNEFYARDTSRKIRAVQKAKGERGISLTVNVPYGYMKDPENKNHWIIDEEAAKVVQRIFNICMEGRGPSQIANQLKADKILTPTAYKIAHGINSPHSAPENPYGWNASSVVNILERREYIGATVNFKTYTNSIWDKKQRNNPIENQAIFYNTHEAIVSEDVFEKVQEIRKQRHRKTKSGKSSMFSGLVFCVDCGEKMYYGATNNYKDANAFFDCSLHWKKKDKCVTHYIRASILEKMVLKHIQEVMGYILRYKQHFTAVMEKQLRIEFTEKIQVSRKQLERIKKRIAELERLFIRIYEDNVNGKLSDERFNVLSNSYEEEQKKLEADAISLRQEIEVQERQNENIEKFIQKAEQYVDITELDAYTLHELVQAIYVEAPDKSDGIRVQHIHIMYDGIGFIPLDELRKEKTA